jgi:hypothetical protein
MYDAVASAAAHVERRRGMRLSVRIALVVRGEEGPLQEHTSTSSLSAYGVLVTLAANVTIGQMLTVQNPDNWAERSGRVIRLGRCYADRTEVGIEFTEPVPDFWLIPAVQ